MTNKDFEQQISNLFVEYRNNNPEKLLKGSKFFKEIGSTQLEDIEYHQQIELKEKLLNKIFSSYYSNIKVIPSKVIQEYRFKSEFAVSYNPKFEPNNRMGQRKKGQFNWVVDLDEYILIEKDTFTKVRQVYEYALKLNLTGYNLKQGLGDLRYLTTKGYKDNLMLIITVAEINPQVDLLLSYAMDIGFKSIYLVLNNTKTDTYEGKIIKYIGEELLSIKFEIDQKEYQFLAGPFTFFQNNLHCFKTLVEDLKETIQNLRVKDLDLYDLYCGVGVLGILFADQFKQVNSYEIVEDSIILANKNKELNKINNINFRCIDVKNIANNKHQDSVTIIDPPRNGLEKLGIENVLKINSKYIFYVSCNPVTLINDLEILTKEYKVIDLKFYDMFPLTHHIEGMCVLERNTSI